MNTSYRTTAISCCVAIAASTIGCSKITTRSLFVPGYEDALKQCSALPADDKADCVRELDATASAGQSVKGFFAERTRQKEAHEAEAHEVERKNALCPIATEQIAAAIRVGKFGRAWHLRNDTSACPDASNIRRFYFQQLRRVPASEIVAFADNTIADEYFNTISIMEWMDYAGRGSFISDRGVRIMGNVSQQFDDYLVISSPYADQSLTVLRLDKKRYVQANALTMVIGRFREIAPFENRLGTRRDLPVFDLLYAYTGY